MSDAGSRLPALGPRGEGWLAAQVLLMAAIGLAGIGGLAGAGSWTPWGVAGSASGGLLIVAGLVIDGVAYTGLRSSFSPLPRPVAHSELVESGIYGRIRHPMYVGVVAGGIGWGLLTGSFLALILSAVLVVLFDAKARREEAWLVARHPAYRDYRTRTRRFIPGIY
ncbi:MAG: methyltransferase family protein [Candidatus Limnocylindrales bacterium]